MPRAHELVLSHQSAAVVWGLDLIRPPDLTHFTVPRASSKLVVPGARMHRANLHPSDTTVRYGTRVTTVERTVVDLTRTLSPPEGVALVDSALRVGVCSPFSLQQLARGATGRGSLPVVRAVALADPSSGSFLESYCRVILTQAGMPPERTQLWISGVDGKRIARVDLAWPSLRVVVELDGFAFHADRGRYRSDRRRINALGLAGWLVLRFTWEDVLGAPNGVVASVRKALYGEVAA